jgi:hypothetical protein
LHSGQPIFPTEFQNNISLVGPLEDDIKLPGRVGLVWSNRRNFDEVPLRILGDKEEAGSFSVGTYYGRSLVVKHGKDNLELPSEVYKRSILYRRKGFPSAETGKFCGAPVALKDACGAYTQVVGFEGFHFKPVKAKAEDLRLPSKDLMDRIKAGTTTIYGALIVSDEFQRDWQIVND